MGTVNAATHGIFLHAINMLCRYEILGISCHPTRSFGFCNRFIPRTDGPASWMSTKRCLAKAQSLARPSKTPQHDGLWNLKLKTIKNRHAARRYDKYIYIYMCVCVYTYVYIYIYMCVCVCMYVCVIIFSLCQYVALRVLGILHFPSS